MTYPNDPNLEPRPRIVETGGGNNSLWIAGILAACLVLGVVFVATTRTSTEAINANTPAATGTATRAPASTTGSGSLTTGGETSSQPAKQLPNQTAPAAPAQ